MAIDKMFIDYLDVNDVMKIMKIKRTKAYSIIRNLNIELKNMGKIVIAGKVPKKYFLERTEV